MNGFLRNISIALLIGALAVPSISAQGRHEGGTNGGRGGRLEHSNGHNRGNQSSHQSNSGNRERPAHNNRPNNSHNSNHQRPSSNPSVNRPSGNSNSGRPAINTGHGNNKQPAVNTPSQNRPNQGNNNRPGINNGNQNRPGINNNGNNKPGNGNNGHNKPGNIGNEHRPGNGNVGNNQPTPSYGTRPAIDNRPNNGGNVTPNRPGHNVTPNRPGHNIAPNRPGTPVGPNRPGLGVGSHRPGQPGFRPGVSHAGPRPPVLAPPHRPHRPPMIRPPHRPMPPRGWRPAPKLPLIRGILGLTFGTAINLSLDHLFSAGYNVDGYTNDVVYLRNVSAMNYIWTDAALYYGNSGLDASSFYYSTPGYDLARYNNVYNSLVQTYGLPVATSNSMNALSATWFGGNNGYITLSFGQNNIGSGLRFLTTLTFGM
ncbi:MAG: hypothetical protein HDS44_04175 [Bacteroides sp.]|nr:hypothetical protein [Bacteroides sp.]